jgi:hypothetical protein
MRSPACLEQASAPGAALHAVDVRDSLFLISHADIVGEAGAASFCREAAGMPTLLWIEFSLLLTNIASIGKW